MISSWDEPTSSLDHKTMEAVEQLFVELKDSCTLLVVSHYLDQVKWIADRVVELRDGVFPMDRGSHGVPDF
jgi:phosphate transport system ATP-binding protein